MLLRNEDSTSTHNDNACHLGNIVMDCFNEPDDYIWQIDAGTDEVEMKSSVKLRSIQLARCLRNAGLTPGDVVAVSGVNHLDLHIPFYAGYFLGLPLMGIDTTFRYEEVKWLFNIVKPKLAFCEVYNVEDYGKVIEFLKLDTRIVTFGDSQNSMANFIKIYDTPTTDKEFRVATFDTNKIFAWLMATSGTTGMPKVAAFTHSEIIKKLKIYSFVRVKEPAPYLVLSSVQWISGYLATMNIITANEYKVHTSKLHTEDHVIDIINKYKPVSVASTPLLISRILRHSKYCDLTCFKTIIVTSFTMKPRVFHQLKARMRPDGVVWNLLGMTECLGVVLMPAPDGPTGNVGIEIPNFPAQLVDTSTGEVIRQPNKIGELWIKGPRLTEYYNDPEATAAAFTVDGWFKTGDLLYRDEKGYFFFAERMSSTIKYQNFYIVPLEVELLIQEHPDVLDVCVVGVPHPEDCARAVACVKRRPGSTITEQDVKDIVTNKLSSKKQIKSVIFVDELPRTFSDKIARRKVLEYVLEVRKTLVFK